MPVQILKSVQERALSLKYSVECGDLSPVSLAKSIRTDDTLSDHEVAARALALVLIKES